MKKPTVYDCSVIELPKNHDPEAREHGVHPGDGRGAPAAEPHSPRHGAGEAPRRGRHGRGGDHLF